MAIFWLNTVKTCNRCKRDFFGGNTRQCKHPNVNKRYGKTICGYCCRKCKYGQNGTCEYLGGQNEC